MKALCSINWKRWVATLCVALIAFITIERAACVDYCVDDTAGGSYNVTSLVVAESGGDEQPGLSGSPAAHHCCAAHCAAMPVLAAMTQPDLQSSAGAIWVDTRAHSTDQDGPERPPRVIAIA